MSDRIHFLTDEISAKPDSQYLHVQRALAYSEQGLTGPAMEDIRRAGSLGESVHTAFAMGVLHYRQGHYGLAKESFDSYLSVNPDHLESLEYRARISRDAGLSTQALADLLRIFDLSKSPNPGLYLSASNLMVALPEYGVQTAIALLDSGMNKLGPITQLQRHAIALLQHQGNYSAAIYRMHQLPPALQITPQWKIDTAKLHLLNQDCNNALTLLQAAKSELDRLPRNGVRDAAKVELMALLKNTWTEEPLEQTSLENI